jgi:lipopolysaccharide biosynthesis protein
MNGARLIAFYLPQFHPTSENDEWWGTGFTEWTNVARARPLFPGHYQPRLPADLGFYDLRVPEVRAAQAELARAAGIEGFCYWHYWFAGRRMLDRPFNEVLASGEPDFPFCLAWANDSWRSHWYGSEKRTLIEQTYPGRADHERHFHALLPAFHDPRYIRVHDRPLFTIFRPENLPDCEQFIELWQDLAVRNGLKGIHFVAHLFDNEIDYPWREAGYSGAVMTNELKLMRRRIWHIVDERLRLLKEEKVAACKLSRAVETLTGTGRLVARRILQRIFRWPDGVHYYSDAMLFFKSMSALERGCYPSVVPGWDNTARARGRGIVLHGSTPELFAEHLTDILESVADRPAEDRIVFVKSWNEWAEGNYLEPDQKFGHGYLNAVRSALDATARAEAALPQARPVVC